MELTKYATVIAGAIVIDVLVMVLLGCVLSVIERRRAQAPEFRWTGLRILHLALGSALCILLLATLAYPLVRHHYRAQAMANGPVWRRVMAIGGHFSVELPGRPELSNTTQRMPDGSMEAQHIVAYDPNTGPSYAAYATDILTEAPVPVEPYAALTRVRDSILLQRHMQLRDTRAVKQDGLNGIEFACDNTQDGPMLFRCFLVKGRLYTLGVGPIAEDEAGPDVRRFFDSFQVE